MKLLLILSFFLGVQVFAGTERPVNISFEPGVEPPELLSQTALFYGPNQTPHPRLISYKVNQPLWVDFAKKKRWFLLPEGEKITFHPQNFWQFPVGTVIVKHFDMEVSKGVYQKIETRLLLHKSDGSWEGYTYQWQEQGEDARLVPSGRGPVVSLQIDDSAAGGARVQNFQIPSRRQCLICHNASVGFVRSLRTSQLHNKDDSEKNQIIALKKFFKKPLGDTSQYPSLSNIEDSHLPAEERVKSYLSVNCAHCHNPGPDAICNWVGIDLRYNHIDLEKLTDGYFFHAGDKERSEIYLRMNRTDRGRMPRIGSYLKDSKALKLIGDWVDSLSH